MSYPVLRRTPSTSSRVSTSSHHSQMSVGRRAGLDDWRSGAGRKDTRAQMMMRSKRRGGGEEFMSSVALSEKGDSDVGDDYDGSHSAGDDGGDGGGGGEESKDTNTTNNQGHSRKKGVKKDVPNISRRGSSVCVLCQGKLAAHPRLCVLLASFVHVSIFHFQFIPIQILTFLSSSLPISISVTNRISFCYPLCSLWPWCSLCPLLPCCCWSLGHTCQYSFSKVSFMQSSCQHVLPYWWLILWLIRSIELAFHVLVNSNVHVYSFWTHSSNQRPFTS